MSKLILIFMIFITQTVSAVEVYSHRGVRWQMPENTLEAVSEGLKLGVEWIDVDVVLSKDNQIVVSHDLILSPNIVRDRNGSFLDNSLATSEFDQKYAVRNKTYSELRQYDVGSLNLNKPYAQFFPKQKPLNGVRMPLLRDVIRLIKAHSIKGKSVGLQIEMKTDPTRSDISPSPKIFAFHLYHLLRSEGMLEQVEIQAFDFRCLVELQKLDARLKTAYLTSRDNERGGVDDFFSNEEEVSGRWTGGTLIRDHNYSIPQMIKAMGGFAWEPEDAQLNLNTLVEAQRLGLKVVVWTWPEMQGTAFDEKLTRRMIQWGVDGIITDDPKRLQEMIAHQAHQGQRFEKNRVRSCHDSLNTHTRIASWGIERAPKN